MKLKYVMPSILLCSTPFIAPYALAEQIEAKVELTKVTLFLKGAELQGRTSISVPKGETEILLTNLANNIDVNSINVGLDDKAMILSTSLVDNYLGETVQSDTLKSLHATLKQLEDEETKLNIKLIAVNEEIALLKGNRIDAITASNGSLTDAKQAISFVKDNLVNALTEQYLLQTQTDDLKQRIVQYQSQIDLESGSARQPQKAIKVKIYTDHDNTLPVVLSYLTEDAGWQPTYDVRVKDINSPLLLTYKANVYQHSGLNWDNIDFILSTANPSQGITAPEPTPWNIYVNEGKSFYGSMSKSTADLATMPQPVMYELKSNTFSDYVVMNHNGLNMQFNVKLPYSIAGQSRDNVLTLKEQDVAATYRYTATPKLDDNAFLQAQITDWDKLSLLPGKSTVFYAGHYIGEGYITTHGLKDNLNISLGRDNAIVVMRNQDINETSKPSFFGNDVSQKFAYTIHIRNTKDVPIDITIYDQLPVILNKTITLEEAKYQGADYKKDTGLLTWQLNIKAKEVKQLPFSFKVSYPKDKAENIIGL